MTTQTTLNLVQKTLQLRELEHFVDALLHAGLFDLVKAGGPFTVFAPRNAAFTGLPDAVLSELARDRGLLSAKVQCHIVPGRFGLRHIATEPTLQSLVGGSLVCERRGGELSVNDSRILRGDLQACNGVLHIVSDVLDRYVPSVTGSGAPGAFASVPDFLGEESGRRAAIPQQRSWS